MLDVTMSVKGLTQADAGVERHAVLEYDSPDGGAPSSLTGSQ
jgi:hypothetical protein